MKKLFVKYKAVIQFILLFLGTYLLLTFLYTLYLKYAEHGVYYPDFFTNLVAKQSNAVIQAFGYNGVVKPEPTGPFMGLYINDVFLARVVEGCNAISIIILFVAFIISFTQKFKKTLLFIFAGIALIYAVNILRIALLTIALYHYPEYTDFLHQIVFPAIIYGMVFLLWLFWVRNLKVKSRNTNE
ncbi:exosortase family protein XrtF [Marixanthomonas ophiurae]|uniref:Exosortase family protein XrtF n=1 Tax=Marixanthomonas ophiurae TaxID=387659 RepID=A0A3E1QC38_9FLAO|nr:exosortase family protein XrtF [Marixanthomonas ophiurae]RFN59664.1 exosortase family protein XrtF [Marixanthomonas ophiurae]